MILDFLFNTAYAADSVSGAAAQHGSMYSTIIMMAAIFAIFYFLLIRPQSKKAKAHRELVSKLGMGDEVVTNSGIYGRITAVDDAHMHLEIADNVVIKIQRQAVSTVLPKGSVTEKS